MDGTQKSKGSRSPYAALAVGILAASTSSIFIRFAQGEAPSLVIAAYRLSLATGFLLPIVALRYREDLGKLTRQQLWLALISGFFLAAHFGTWISSLEYISVASSVVFVQTAPLFVALIAPITLREPVTKAIAAGLILAFGGSVLVGLSDICSLEPSFACPTWTSLISGPSIKGDVLALSGAFSGAIYMIIGRKLRQGIALIPYITLVYGAAALALILASLLASQPFTGFSASTYLLLLLLAVFPQLIAHSTYNWALKFLPAAVVSISLLGEPVAATILALVLLGEQPTWLRILGAVFILLGIFIVSVIREKKNEPSPEIKG